jgi:flagellar biosynthesis protein FlhF
MQPIPFIASSAEEAVAQIRARLGSQAVVLNVRPMPANGIARLWQKPMIEVLAYLPELVTAPEPVPDADALAEFRQQLNDIRQQVQSRAAKSDYQPEPQFISSAAEIEFPILAPAAPPVTVAEMSVLDGSEWRVGPVLEKSGLQPLHAQSVVDRIRQQHGDVPPGSLAEEITLARSALSGCWRSPRPLGQNSRHILIGPAGSGKTTYLCKWLTQAVLVEGRVARVWRLDGATANMAESLSVYCDILGVPGERTWTGAAAVAEDVGFIDLPGVDWRNPLALKELAGQLRQFGSPRVHLVLNGAYDISVLLAQVRAFSTLPVEDLVITHLDEEPRWGKIWNLVLGANYPIRHFGTGQNIPGDFCEASPEAVLLRQFPHR